MYCFAVALPRKNLFVLLLSIAMLTACNKNDEKKAAPIIKPEVLLKIDSSDLVQAVNTDLSVSLSVSGSLKAQKQSIVKSKSAGEILELNFKEGMQVTAGQRVARIDDLDSRLRLNERTAARNASQAQLDLVQRTYLNQKQLFDKGFISQAGLDNSQTQLTVARANLDSANASVKLSEKSLSDAVLTAPINGTVAELFVQRGEKVASDARLLSIVDLRSIEFEAPLPAEMIGSVNVGQTVEIRIDGVTSQVLGRIERINPSTQAGSRSIPVHVALTGDVPNLKVGMFAEGRFITAQRNKVIAVPVAAIREVAGRKFVYLVDAEKKIQERTVVTGISDNKANIGKMQGLVEITQGLTAGETLIAANLGPLKTGTIVQTAK